MVLLELEYLHEIGRTTLGSKPVCDYLHERIGLQLRQHAFMDVIQIAAKQSWISFQFPASGLQGLRPGRMKM
jgi:hypothetical protein